jgi:hypothetical protein
MLNLRPRFYFGLIIKVDLDLNNTYLLGNNGMIVWREKDGNELNNREFLLLNKLVHVECWHVGD